MKHEGIPPAPTNFEVWYVYFANVNQDLKTELNAIRAANGKITAQDCLMLHQKYLSENRHQDLYQKAGDQIHSALQDVSGLMNNVREATTEYSGTLESVTQKISTVKSPEDIKKVMESVAKDTAKMLEQNKKLEDQLSKSSRAMDELKHDLERVRREAMTDGLTGLSNRKSFDDQIKSLADSCIQEGKTFTLLMVDIDHFKSFNDNFGHQVGDQVLRLVARTLTDGVKGKDFAARYGGEEFAILLPDTNLNGGVIVGDNLRKTLATKEIVNRASGEHLGKITMSVGAAQFYPGEDTESLIERADAALYTAKHNGRNQVAAAPTPVLSSQKKA
ncbi:MAG: diguanylate cyclase [Alphaproteobacteria bacterium]|nr:diguanylate cyclase [Alphaproteobacteria bacterium]